MMKHLLFASFIYLSACLAFAGNFYSESHSLKADFKGEIPHPVPLVFIPDLKGGFLFTFTGLYLLPTNADLDYATLSTSTVTGLDTTFSQKIETTKPHYAPAFKLGLEYIFDHTGNDIQINWIHFRQTYHSSFRGLPGQTLVTQFNITQPIGIPIPIGDDIVFIDSMAETNHSNFKYDVGDFDFGQFINLGAQLRLRIFAGLRAAYLESNMLNDISASGTKFVTADDITISVTSRLRETLHSKFGGIGPRFGVESSYLLSHGFSVIGNLAAALLVGRIDSKSEAPIFVNDGGTILTQTITINSPNVTRVVPGFDAKLGLNFATHFSSGVLDIEAGYELSHYIDVIDRLIPELDMVTSGFPETPVITNRKTSSLGFAGFYLAFHFSF